MGYLRSGVSALGVAILFTLLPSIHGCSGSSNRAGPISSMSNKIFVSNDNGGKLIKYAMKVKKVQNSGKIVEFNGSCNSACTLYLGLPRHQTCISSGAKFSFHMPYGVSNSDQITARDYMMRTYPIWVRSWIRRSGGLSQRIITMGYDYASIFLKPCSTGFALKPSNIRFVTII